jgi:pectate lyase
MDRYAFLLLAGLVVMAAQSRESAGASFRWSQYERKSDDWFRGEEARTIAANLRSQQSSRGDWLKNTDTGARRGTDSPDRIKGTFDNGATVGEIRFLARAFRATGDVADRDACLKGIDHVLAAQYANGGWPQTSPPGADYPRHITFNDNTMLNLLTLTRDIAGGEGDEFAFAGDARRQAARQAFASGIDCILRCQVRVRGELTVWCAQHDAENLEPAKARSYELPSLSGSESAGLLMLLMSLDDPSPEVVRAVEAGVRWYESAKRTGLREVTVDGDKSLRPDPDAPALWARFYDLETNRPFFCGRDGVKKDDYADIEAERRNGYAWYGTWGDKVARRYPRWKQERTGDGKP